MSRYIDPPGIDSIKVGRGFEEFICERHHLRRKKDKAFQFEHGDATTGIIHSEIKHDPHTKYRHLMIEVAANPRRKGWHLGGVFASSDAHWYYHGDKKTYWRFTVPDLREWLNKKGVTPDVVQMHTKGQRHKLLKEFQGTMLRVQMEYREANEVGQRFET